MGKQVGPEHRRDLTLKEAAYELSVSTDWLRKRLGTPSAPPHIVRGPYFIFPRELFQAWQDNQIKQAREAPRQLPYWARRKHAASTP